MENDIVQIPGDFYFKKDGVPVAIRRVRGTVLTHTHNYTGIPHWHDFSELVIITSGDGIQNINGRSYQVSAGDVFVITGKTVHYFEEYQNLELVNFDPELFEAFTKGFIDGCGGSLTEKEIETLPLGAITMTAECGVRFLTDYLDGDRYFKINYPEHNLDRALCQLKLAQDMIEKQDAMMQIVEKCLSGKELL